LVHAGVLPEREEYLETIPSWLDELLATRPAAHAQIIRPYASWSILRRARHRARRRPGTRSVGKHARAAPAIGPAAGRARAASANTPAPASSSPRTS
jgi:hypothetical protein